MGVLCGFAAGAAAAFPGAGDFWDLPVFAGAGGTVAATLPNSSRVITIGFRHSGQETGLAVM
jgi:hypothetical protein